MTIQFKYGVASSPGLRVGDRVRFVSAPSPGQPGAVFSGSGSNATLRNLIGLAAYVELDSSPAVSLSTLTEGGAAMGVRVQIPVRVGGTLKVS